MKGYEQEDHDSHGIQEGIEEDQETEGRKEILCKDPHIQDRQRNKILFQVVKDKSYID